MEEYIWLVVWNMNFYDFPYIGNNHPNWRTHIFQRGRYTTNQCNMAMSENSVYPKYGYFDREIYWYTNILGTPF